MKRRKPAELPACPFETGQKIKVQPKNSDEWITGTVSACLWFPFPGQWIPEVKTEDGTIYGIGGHAIPIREYETIPEKETAEDWIAAHPEIEAANEQSRDELRIEQTEAGAQVVAPGTPARTIPTSGLRPKVWQREGPLPLELAEVEAKQQRLF